MVATSSQDSKYAVASILTSMATSHQVPTLAADTADGTELLTPNTLRTIEKTLDEIQEGSEDALGYAGAGWEEPPAKVARSSVSPAHSTDCYTGSPSQGDDEEERRRMRRERNKIAAAKCRKRRVDLTNYLQDETDKLEAERSRLEEEISDLQRQKEQLEFVMQAHRPVCRMLKVPQADRPVNLKVLEETSSKVQPTILPPKKIPSRPSNLPVNSVSINKQPAAPVPRRRTDSDLNTPIVGERVPLILPPKKSPIRARKFLEGLSNDDLNTPVVGLVTPLGPSHLVNPLPINTKQEPTDLDTPKGSEAATGVHISTPSNEMPQLGLDTGTGLTPLMSDFRSVVPAEDVPDVEQKQSDISESAL